MFMARLLCAFWVLFPVSVFRPHDDGAAENAPATSVTVHRTRSPLAR